MKKQIDPILVYESLDKMKESDNSGNEVMSFTTKDGKEVKMVEFDGEGMAGETMTFLYTYLDGKIVRLQELIDMLDDGFGILNRS